MAENQQSAERTERATPRRRRQAREKGTVARSSDLTSSAVMLGLALLLPMLLTGFGVAVVSMVRSGMDVAHVTSDSSDMGYRIWNIARPVIVAALPIFLLGASIGVATGFLQVGFHPTFEPINPNFDRLNPISGFKRLLSKQAAFETIKTCLKLLFFGWIAYSSAMARSDELSALGSLSAQQSVIWVARLLGEILLKTAFVWLILGAIDYAFQRWQVERQIMMTKEEVKREMRETETSPELRAEMHRRRRRLARARMMQNVKHADVVITNPTEYAVALKYDPKKSGAPLCLAKGRHLLADRIRSEATKARVPIVPNPPLARSLYEQVEVGDAIPTALYQAVAEVLAFVFRLKGKRA